MSFPARYPTISPPVDHQADLGLGHVPAGVGADADRLAVGDDPGRGRLEEDLRPSRGVDVVVEGFVARLLDPAVTAASIGDAGGPDLLLVDRRQCVGRGEGQRTAGHLLDRGLCLGQRQREQLSEGQRQRSHLRRSGMAEDAQGGRPSWRKRTRGMSVLFVRGRLEEGEELAGGPDAEPAHRSG